MDVDKLCPTGLEIVNTALGSQAVSVGIPALSIFSSVMEEDQESQDSPRTGPVVFNQGSNFSKPQFPHL